MQNREETFEEYIKSVTSYCPDIILTDDRIEHYREIFKNIQIREIEQNYFEPYDREQCEYDTLLKQLLDLNEPIEDEFIISIAPSFESEYGFRVLRQNQEYKISKNSLDGNLWEKFYSKEDLQSVKMTCEEFILDKEIGILLFQILHKAFDTAKTPKANFVTLDGVVHSISKKEKNEIITIFKHSPNEKSWTAKVLDIIEKLPSVAKTELESIKLELLELLEFKH